MPDAQLIKSISVKPGTFVYAPRMLPVWAIYAPYMLSQVSPLVPDLGRFGTYSAMLAGPSIGTTVLAASFAFAYKRTLPKGLFASPRTNCRRHNRSLCIGAAGMVGLETYAIAFKPVPAHPHGLADLGCTSLAAALTVALLWARKPKPPAKKPAQASPHAIPA